MTTEDLLTKATNKESYFFHSFPRPRKDENFRATAKRALKIISFMSEVGLILAPEIVKWQTEPIAGEGEPPLEFIQKRACFTELSEDLLPNHSRTFGPVSLAFDIKALRSIGATPVVYAPQGISDQVVSYLSTFLVRGAYNTRAVMQALHDLNTVRSKLVAQYGLVADNCVANLKNEYPPGHISQEFTVALKDIESVLSHILFRNIPFDHSISVLDMFQNMFYPTDNDHAGDALGYYRQREWRLIGSNIAFNGFPLCRELTAIEKGKLEKVDKSFWAKGIVCKGDRSKRLDLAVIYQGYEGWSIFDAIKKVIVPHIIFEDMKKLVGRHVEIELAQ